MLKDIIALFVNFLNMQTGTILTAGASWAIGVSFKDLITSIVTSIIQPLITKIFIWLNINKLIKILKNPYLVNNDDLEFISPAPHSDKKYQTFCGT